MSMPVYVFATRLLNEFSAALTRFQGDVAACLEAVGLEVRRTFEYLDARIEYWRHEVLRRQEAYRVAEAQLRQCQSTVYQDPRTGQYYRPDCSAYMQAALLARSRLAEAEAALQETREWRKLFERSVADYDLQARRLGAQLQDEVPRAAARVEHLATHIELYVGESRGDWTAGAPGQGVFPEPANATPLGWSGGAAPGGVEIESSPEQGEAGVGERKG